MWIGMMKSGIHATLAGVLTAMTVPAGFSVPGPAVRRDNGTTGGRFKTVHTPGRNILENEEQQPILQSMEDNVHRMESPLQRMEHGLHAWVSFLVIPLFALANAGIAIDFGQFPDILGQPVTLGIMAGLVLRQGGRGLSLLLAGRPSWLVPAAGGFEFPILAGVSLLAGIGFTMAIFIAGLAFPEQQTYLVHAKIGIFLASLAAGLRGYLLLRLFSVKE